MKKILVPIIMILASLLGINIAYAIATPTTWMGDFSAQTLVPQAAYNSANVKGAYFTATSTTATSTFPIIRYGEVGITHADGSYTSYPATTSSAVGRGTLLQTLVATCQANDQFYIASTSYDLGAATLQNLYTCGASIHGIGFPTITSTAHSASGINIPEIFHLATGTIAENINILAPNQAASNFQMCVLADAPNVVIRNLKCTSGSDGIWAQASTLFDGVQIYSNWDGIDIIQGAGTTTVRNSIVYSSTTAAINSSQEARAIVNSTGPLYLSNTSITAIGGTSDNYGVFTTGNLISPASTYFLNGSVTTAGSGTNYDIYNFDTGGHISKTYVGANVSYDHTKVSGTLSPYQDVASAGAMNAMTATATSTFAGGIAVQTNGFVVNASNAYVGIGVKTPTNPFQIGNAFTVSRPGTLSSTQSYDNLGECYTSNGDTITGHLHAYRTDPSTGFQVSSTEQDFTFTDDNSGSTYTNHWSWSAASGVEGYWLEVEDNAIFGSFDNWIQLGLVTSYADDGCTNVGTPSFEAQTQPYFVTDSSGHSGVGVVPSTGNALSILNSNSSALDIYSAINTGGNNSNGDIRILDPNNGNIVFRIGETGSDIGSAFMQEGYQSSGGSILSEWDILNGNVSAGDKRVIVIQGLTDTTKENAQVVFAPSNGASTPIIMEMRGSVGRTAFSSTNLIYGANMGSTITNYGNLSVGSAYSNISAPPNGAIIAGQTGIGTSTPWATLSVSTSTQNNGLVPLLAVASTTNKTLLTVLGNGAVQIGTTTSAGILNIGTDLSSASTTIVMSKLQFDGYNTAGVRVCAEVTTLNVWAITAGACTP